MKNLSTILLIAIYACIAVLVIFGFDCDLPQIDVQHSWMAAIGAMAGGGGGGGGGGGMMEAAKGATDKVEGRVQGRKNAHMQGTMGVFQAVQGLGQSIHGAILKKKADALFPDKVDPIRASALANYKRMERGAATGSLYQGEVDKLLQGERGLQKNIVSHSGGSTGGALGALALSGRTSGTQRNNLMGLVMQNRDKYTALADATSKEISQRKLEVESWKYSQKMAEATQMVGKGEANMTAGATNMMSSAWG